jgi:peptidoglycan/LPS O-acetylase OafA/YrhL
LRIWPLYFAVLAFAYFAYPALQTALGSSEQFESGSAWCYWAFLSNFDVMKMARGEGLIITNVTWSVAIEEQFYLFWPLCFLLVPRRWYRFIFPAFMLLALVFRACHLDEPRVLYFHTLSAIGDLALGGGLAYLSLRCPTFLTLVQRLPRWLTVVVYVVGLLLIVYADVWTTWPGLKLFSRLILGCFFGFVIVEQNFAVRSPFKMASLPWATLWGQHTYGLYLLHTIPILCLLLTCRALDFDTSHLAVVLVAGALALPLSLGLAYASYRWYEQPFLRLKDRFKPRKRVAQSVPQTERDVVESPRLIPALAEGAD